MKVVLISTYITVALILLLGLIVLEKYFEPVSRVAAGIIIIITHYLIVNKIFNFLEKEK